MVNKNFFNEDMKKAMLKFFILSRIKESKINAYAILKKFSSNKRFARRFSGKLEMRNEVYNALKSLENAGYIKVVSRQMAKNRKLKNYYTLTKRGSDVLKSARMLMVRHMREMSSILSG
ncbi:MAG: PadR family transcriptional regulator [Candidatus Micrarchaeales archaeon]